MKIPRMKIKKYFSKLLRQRMLRKKISQYNNDLKVILGAGPTKEDGWVETNYPEVDITSKRTFANFFPKRNVRNFFAEHVWEHLTLEESLIAIENCHEYLTPGGCLRIAVPDGFHVDPDYINYVKPGGIGAGSDDHKVLFNYKILAGLLGQAGFEVNVLEWFDEHGKFHSQDWAVDAGLVVRSTRFDPRNIENPTAYTSLIIDGLKL